jgi:cysteinyl-tRNA synthetase
VEAWEKACYQAMNEDFNTPILIAQLFEGVRQVNLILDNKAGLTTASLQRFKEQFRTFVFEILGLVDERENQDSKITDGLIQFIISLRTQAKENRDFATSDKIRDQLKDLGVQLKDGKEGTTYSIQS